MGVAEASFIDVFGAFLNLGRHFGAVRKQGWL
jgi:hypothetical protein